MSRVKVDGLRELERNLMALGKQTTAKSVARRVLKNAGQPIADKANSLAPDDPTTEGGLNRSYAVSTKLNKNQRKIAKQAGKSGVEVYVGTGDPAGLQQEFGNVNHAAQPHFRPAWDSEKRPTLERIKNTLGDEIMKTAKRLAKRAAKLAAKGG